MSDQEFTYPEVGATETLDLPDGYKHLRVRTLVGHGPGALREAGDALMEFWMHRALPARVDATARRAAPGVGVVIGLGVGPLRMKAPCRVVWTVEREDRVGWAYGTLPGHPACGEEAFVVHRDAEDDVWLTVTAFSRPCSRAARLGGPIVPVLQRAYARRCGAVLRKLARRR
ncbi:DUF1990 family protein [Actinomadura parmotrematis]|uniref:DUF1990 domain-containing protein n=1 Tax=Actinomadura parmotrematis TaxID=2864039 RepID=A0ABS7FTK7_9ACTN|nr:DUF1990 domain-containing protein [Actinomadura parmotrematis]MBW8483626.1 DUF1990 domain-containing protein [Actinomadura parmotrematis]